ncbi:signal peptidase II [Erysipelothrix rhusiopathiae]|uniref:signal peptidase II n=1 Tax=Erysipelothrix rhusiopathiae TaxID=1648 RepID=UPI000F4376FA|nr:signal peptidase II [Erysipelothrix rhusiopathiae]AYV34390.1 signal peptidase II [Erysipelothrix rhusiopathiae]MDE8314968.1 signal peptidase II [Erysipelothrix rhusiopathiae]MDE8329220.1 signal peptidase II [Erysipelothrix rhusiopathiae]MDE8332418.1 signal peptidase II [Erysipelothrix rhusiopathiae]
MKKRLGLLSVVIIAVDLLSKAWIDKTIPLWESLHVIPGFFSLRYVRNTGAAWSMFDGQKWLFIVLATAVCIVLAYYYVKEDKPVILTAIALMFAGAFGNLFDRAIYGYVRDMFAFNIFGYQFPVFNVADMSLVVGVFILAIVLYLDERGQKYE